MQIRGTILLPGLVLIAGCASPPQEPVSELEQSQPEQQYVNDDYGPEKAVDVSHIPDAIPRKEPPSRYGNPESYTVRGKTYKVSTAPPGFKQTGIASWYGLKFHGQRTSSGEAYDMYKMTAAHKTLTIPCYVRVTNLENGKQVVVRVNDRGPFHPNRIIDLSYTAAVRLGVQQKGTAAVEIAIITPDKEAEPARPTMVSGDGPAMYLQTGAFSSEENAQKQQDQLRGLTEWPVLVEKTEVNGKTLYKVQVGPLETISTLDQIAANLTANGIKNSHVLIR